MHQPTWYDTSGKCLGIFGPKFDLWPIHMKKHMLKIINTLNEHQSPQGITSAVAHLLGFKKK